MLFQTELMTLIENHIKETGFHFSDDGKTAINRFIEDGIHILSNSEFNLDRRNGAKAKLLFFADESMSLAKQRNTKKIDRTIIERIKSLLCPLYPFC